MNAPLVDAHGAAALLGIQPETVREWARRGRLPVVRLGYGPKKRMRFKPEDIDILVKSRREG